MDDNGEPIAMLEGVSVWPTVLLRVLGIILTGYFIWRAKCTLRENLAGIATDIMGIDLKQKPESQEKRSLWKKFTVLWKKFTSVLKDKRLLWKPITSVFDFSLGGNQANVEAVWEAYVGQERFWPRCTRAVIFTTGMYLIGRFVLVPMFGMPMNQARGALAHDVFYWTTLIDVILMQFLTFFSSTRLCSACSS
jgi:hypothetical protein